MPAIEASGASLTYSDGTEAVKDVSLEIPEGEFFGFLGPNGAGKTTTIKMLVTLYRPTSGTIRVNGYDVETEPQGVRESVGYMAQETSVDPELTARENIRFACEIYGVRKARVEDRIDDLLDLVDLADDADKEARELSGGMQKRLDMATALVHRPPIVFLDEPTTGLDPKVRLRLWDYFREINDRGTTVFLTTQYLEEADELCDRLSVIQDGEVVATDSPERLKSQVGGDVFEITLENPSEEAKRRAMRVAHDSGQFEDATIETTEFGIGVSADNAREAGVDLLMEMRESDLSVSEFDLQSPTLDDVFLAITDEETDSQRDADDGSETEMIADDGSETEMIADATEGR